MLRFLVATFALSLLLHPAQAQTPTATAPEPAAKPAVKKPAAKPKASAKPAGPVEAGPCQIGVIAEMGETFAVQAVGFTVFGNEKTDVPIGPWGLDDLVIARVRAAAGPGVSVRKIAHTRDAFAQMNQSGSFFRDMKAELSNAVRQIASGSNCQRYVLVNSSSSRFSNLNQSVHGVGIVSWAHRTLLFALSYIRVYDGQSFEVIKQGAATANDESLVSQALMLNPIRGPNRELERSAFPSTPAEAATSATLRDGVRALLTRSLDNTLPAMLR